MLVDSLTKTALVNAECSSEKTRLLEQARRTAVAVVEALDQQRLESIDALTLPPELIVETHHLGDETRTHLERRHNPGGHGFISRRVKHDLAVPRRQPAWRRSQACVKAVVELVPRDELRRRTAERTLELAGGPSRRHNDGGRREQVVRGVCGKGGDRASKRVQVWDAHEPRPARRDH